MTLVLDFQFKLKISKKDIKKHATSGGKDLKDMKELCYIEIEGEMNFANYAFWCFPLTAVVGMVSRDLQFNEILT